MEDRHTENQRPKDGGGLVRGIQSGCTAGLDDDMGFHRREIVGEKTEENDMRDAAEEGEPTHIVLLDLPGQTGQRSRRNAGTDSRRHPSPCVVDL